MKAQTAREILNQCKDEVAGRHDYPTWWNILHDLVDRNVPVQFVSECEDEVTNLYGKRIAELSWEAGFERGDTHRFSDKEQTKYEFLKSLFPEEENV